MAEKILFFNAKSCTAVDQYVLIAHGFVWICLGLLRGKTHVAVSFAGEWSKWSARIKAILMVPNVALTN
jgi:hypothetical protein